MTFDALVQTEDEGVFVELPADSEFARARAPVTVTINGVSWESSVADYGGRFYLPLRRGIRQLARIAPGDTVSVTLADR
jgi:Domain of unknown function (DUF1905)